MTSAQFVGISSLVLTVSLFNTDLMRADESVEEEKRRAAIAAILQVGGHIRVVVPQPTVDRLERLTISAIDLREAKVDNALLLHVGNLTEVRRLDLSNAEIDDIGLAQISHLPLRELWLQSTKITDVSADTISRMKTLDFLQLNSTDVTDVFRDELTAMPKLADLGLRGTFVTGKGMDYLSRHPKLKKLDVYHTSVDDDGVAFLSNCKTLTFVGLSKTKITDKALEHLAKLPNLTRTDLSANRHVTDEAISAFQKAQPDCNVEGGAK